MQRVWHSIPVTHSSQGHANGYCNLDTVPYKCQQVSNARANNMSNDTVTWMLCHTSAIQVSKSHTRAKHMPKDAGRACSDAEVRAIEEEQVVVAPRRRVGGASWQRVEVPGS